MQGECEEAAPQDLTNRMAGLCELLSGSASLDQSEPAWRFPSVSSERSRAGAEFSGVCSSQCQSLPVWSHSHSSPVFYSDPTSHQ